MTSEILKLNKRWERENIISSARATEKDILLFESSNNVTIPTDLKEYFLMLNGTSGKYDDNFFQFYALNQFSTIKQVYQDWKGKPNYQDLKSNLEEYESYFVFADYQISLFAYAIKLSKAITYETSILVICGDEYREIAKSFSSFLELYIEDPYSVHY